MTSATSAQLRKIKKPLIERRRRERINDCLHQLKMIVLEATQKDESRYSKMEKADILEMTVTHLQNVCRCPTTSTGPTERGSGRYLAGYRQCAVEVARYLAHQAAAAGRRSSGTPPSAVDAVRARLMRHLTAVLQTKLLQSPDEVDSEQRSPTTTMTSFAAEAEAEVRWRSDCSSTCSSDTVSRVDEECTASAVSPGCPTCGVDSGMVDRFADSISLNPATGLVSDLSPNVDLLTARCYDSDSRVWRPW